MDYFPIGRVSELTGIPPVTLRAWERRYGHPVPRRTASGHRLYSMQEVALIRRVTALMESGYSVSRAMERIQTEEDYGTAPPEGEGLTKWDGYRQRLLDAVARFDTTSLENAYNEPLTLFPIDLIIDEVLLPVLEQLGEEWDTRPDGIAREHFFSAFLRNKIGARFNHEVQRGQGPSLLLACLPGESHEMGLMLAGLAAAARGFRVLYLGADLPLAQLLPVAEAVNPASIVLSATCVAIDDAMAEELSNLCRKTTPPVYIGGDVAEREEPQLQQLGVIPVGRRLREGVERIIQASRQN